MIRCGFQLRSCASRRTFNSISYNLRSTFIRSDIPQAPKYDIPSVEKKLPPDLQNFSYAKNIGRLLKEYYRRQYSKFPRVTDKRVAYWLFGSAAGVFGIVVLGGLTRLTESGLSITEWKPVTGSLPPISHEAWEQEFEKYKSSPEFLQLNSQMEISQFKKIYWMEWAHRLWGRVIGLTFIVPTVYCIATRRVNVNMALTLIGTSGLIGLQGVVGWWMVKSGLSAEELAANNNSPPRVSQYRLAVHLGLAFIVYSIMLASGCRILRVHSLLKQPATIPQTIAQFNKPIFNRMKHLSTALTGLIFCTAMSGAFVAGLDAGLIYNEFPYMGEGFTPPKSELWDVSYARKPDGSDWWWRNLTANPSLVQLNHRILAISTATSICALWLYTRRLPIKSLLPNDVQSMMTGMLHLVGLQVTLGISTLIYFVPTWLAAAHQAGSLTLLTLALILRCRLTIPSTITNIKPILNSSPNLSPLQNRIKSQNFPIWTAPPPAVP